MAADIDPYRANVRGKDRVAVLLLDELPVNVVEPSAPSQCSNNETLVKYGSGIRSHPFLYEIINAVIYLE